MLHSITFKEVCHSYPLKLYLRQNKASWWNATTPSLSISAIYQLELDKSWSKAPQIALNNSPVHSSLKVALATNYTSVRNHSRKAVLSTPGTAGSSGLISLRRWEIMADYPLSLMLKNSWLTWRKEMSLNINSKRKPKVMRNNSTVMLKAKHYWMLGAILLRQPWLKLREISIRLMISKMHLHLLWLILKRFPS